MAISLGAPVLGLCLVAGFDGVSVRTMVLGASKKRLVTNGRVSLGGVVPSVRTRPRVP